nr:FeoA domain-containing protein [Candidatus Baldrarchaeota archaeon]
MIPLAFAREGTQVKVIKINAGKGLSRRLTELGIIPGAILKIVKTQGPGPVIIEVCNSKLLFSPCDSCTLGCSSSYGWRIVLSFGMAMKILVQELM